MRFKLYFELENNQISIQYRKSLISYIKHSIQEYNEDLYKQIYNANSKKTFCFSPILPKSNFVKEEIILENNYFIIIFSAYDYLYGLHLYNALLNQKGKKFSLNRNSMTLTNIITIPEKEVKNKKIIIKTASPIICRNHDQITKKDMYYYAENDEFQKYIRINIEEQMQAENLDKSLLEGFKIEPLETKKIIIKLYEKKIESTIGTFQLEGKIELLNYLMKAGCGSKKAMGFGLLEMI